MNARDIVFDSVLPVFKSCFGRFERGDLLFFGDRADVVSPAPRKYSLDAEPNMVYNVKSSSVKGVPLFKDVTVSDGYVNMTFSDEAFSLLAEGFAEGRSPARMPDAFETGSREALLAALVPLSRYDGGVFPPEDPLVRRAVLYSMFADTPESVSRAYELIRRAVFLDRRARCEGLRLISGKAALVMALALEESNQQLAISNW